MTAVGAINHLPLAGDVWTLGYSIDGRAASPAGQAPHAVYRVVQPGYFPAMALPLVLNSTVQAVLNLTDTWFIGRLSTSATAAIAAIHWLALLAIFLIGGVAMGVQTLAAQAFGAGRFRRASRVAWLGLWASALSIPAFGLTVAFGPAMIRAFGLAPDVEALAIEFWIPRMIGGPLAAALWAVNAFFNGIGRTRSCACSSAACAAPTSRRSRRGSSSRRASSATRSRAAWPAWGGE